MFKGYLTGLKFFVKYIDIHMQVYVCVERVSDYHVNKKYLQHELAKEIYTEIFV